MVTILRILSATGRSKAFSICSSHILVVSLFMAFLVHLPPTKGCTHSRNRHSNCTHAHSCHTCSESSYLHLEKQGSEGSLSKTNTMEHSQTNDLNLFITKLFRNTCICQKYSRIFSSSKFLDSRISVISWKREERNLFTKLVWHFIPELHSSSSVCESLKSLFFIYRERNISTDSWFSRMKRGSKTETSKMPFV